MFEIISSLLKYAFTVIIYIFILSIIRLILIDIRSMSEKSSPKGAARCFLKLVSVQGVLDFKIEEVYLLTTDISIGRSPNNGISLDDTFLSGIHACFIDKRGSFWLRDNESTNGTFVNGKKLGKKPVKLKNGDKIHLGRIDFLFVSEKRMGDR
ncbi:MAG: FHA domain-containing protein [Clostridia bacterium]|nr:FHA domain-containing protein [Clostridia bacterium]